MNHTANIMHMWLTRFNKAPLELVHKFQLHQATNILRHAIHNTDAYKNVIAPDEHLTWEFFKTLPIVTKKQIQENPEAYLAKNRAKYGDVFVDMSSGSTGTPMTVHRVDSCYAADECVIYRAFIQMNFDPTKTLGVIRPNHGETEFDSWCDGVETGKMLVFSSSNSVRTQLQWLVDNDVKYLMSPPSNVEALVNEYIQTGVKPNLMGVITIGETVKPHVRKMVEANFGCKLRDLYSSVELLTIASECSCGTYHVNDELMIVEVLNERGEWCKPGEIGEVVITHLYNYAMPLIRYKNGDYAEVGDVCLCGSNSTTLRRIIGRERNMLLLPNGDKIWPSFPIEEWLEVTDKIEQLQLIQTARNNIRINLKTKADLNTTEKCGITEMLTKNFGHQFDYEFSNEVVVGTGGKFEDFINRCSDI